MMNKTLLQIDAGEIEITDITELEGFKVGQKLTPPDAGARTEIRKAKTLTVVGFTKYGRVVVRINGNVERFPEAENKHIALWPRDINMERDRDRSGAFQYGCIGFGGA